MCSWLCGLHRSQESTASTEEEHKNVVNSLEENPRVKIILNVNFGILVAVGIGIFAYFTTDPFPADIDPRTYVLQ